MGISVFFHWILGYLSRRSARRPSAASAASACVPAVHVGGALGFRADDASPPFPPFGAEVDETLSHAYTGPFLGTG